MGRGRGRAPMSGHVRCQGQTEQDAATSVLTHSRRSTPSIFLRMILRKKILSQMLTIDLGGLKTSGAGGCTPKARHTKRRTPWRVGYAVSTAASSSIAWACPRRTLGSPRPPPPRHLGVVRHRDRKKTKIGSRTWRQNMNTRHVQELRSVINQSERVAALHSQ